MGVVVPRTDFARTGIDIAQKQLIDLMIIHNVLTMGHNGGQVTIGEISGRRIHIHVGTIM